MGFAQLRDKKALQSGKLLLSFALLFALALLFPYTGDDWAWGSEIGLKRLRSLFAGYNGRYLGNLLILCLSRSRLLCAAVTAAVLVSLCVLARKIVGWPWAGELTALFLFLAPKGIWAQTVVFASGFANYTTAALLLLLFEAMAWRGAEHPMKRPWLSAAAFALTGFVGSLFMEHVTIAALLLSAGFSLMLRARSGRWRLPLLAHTAAAAAGAALMFSNSAYRSIAAGTDNYRSFSDGGLIDRALHNYFYMIYQKGFLQNAFLNVALFVVCLFAFFLLRKRLHTWAARLCLAVQGAFACYSLFAVCYVPDERKGGFLYAEGLFALLGLAALFGTLLYLAAALRDPAIKRRILFNEAAILLLLAPLFPVTPLMDRCFLPSYLMFVLLLSLAVKLCASALRAVQTQALQESIQEAKMLVKAGLAAALAALYLFQAGVFYSVHKADVARLAHIRAELEAGKTEAEVLILPYKSFLWTSTPDRHVWDGEYKAFHGLPQELQLTAVSEYTE